MNSILSSARDQSAAAIWAWRAALLAIAGLVLLRWLAIFFDSINWDEFALMARAESAVRLGVVHGGGRPGLVTLALTPFVKGCVDSVQAVVNARILWQFLTVAYLVGIYASVRRWITYSLDPSGNGNEAWWAVALLAFLPAFVTWSVQVRTDQAALAAAVWGTACLLSSRDRYAMAAGILFAISVLCTQKGLYVIGLAAILFCTATVARMRTAELGYREEIVRATRRVGLAGTAAIVTVGLYLTVVPNAASVVSQASVSSALDGMNRYRELLGYRVYYVHASRLWAHWILLGLMVIWTLRVLFAGGSHNWIRLGTCWLVLALGVAVAMIHGSSFAYFLMTAGLFPAIALGLASRPGLEIIGRRGPLVAVLLMALLVLNSLPETFQMLTNTQKYQRETLRLVEMSSLREARGYQVEGALFCASDPDPMPTMFSQQIARRAARGPDAFDDFVQQFRDRPIAYIVGSYRMEYFPDNVREFWAQHYIPYAAALHIAGFRVLPGRLDSTHEVIVGGTYRWVTNRVGQDGVIQIDGKPVEPNQTFWLDVGTHHVSKALRTTGGSVVLAIPADPRRGIFPFYDIRQRRQLGGHQ